MYNNSESAVTWSLRLGKILKTAINKEHVRPEDKSNILRNRLWNGLKSERLKNATRRPRYPDRNHTDPQRKNKQKRRIFRRRLRHGAYWGQTPTKPQKCHFFSRFIGNSNVSTVEINGISARALIDSGSQITTLSEEFYNSLDPKPDFNDIVEFNLKIKAAVGNIVPYSGCIKCLLQVPFVGGHVIEIGAFVVPTTDYTLEVPVIVRTNAIEACRKVFAQ